MKLKTTEKGFTLMELLVALSIAAFVTAAASMTIITMMRLTPMTNNWAIALRQVQNTGYWISRDVQSSKAVNPSPPSPQFLVFTIPTGPTTSKTVIYQFETMSGSEWLTRTDSTGGKTAIAQYISIPTSPVYNNRTLTFTIRATSGNVPVTRTYEATQRVPP